MEVKVAALRGVRVSLNNQNTGEKVAIVAEYLDTLVISHKTACCPQTCGVGEATTRAELNG